MANDAPKLDILAIGPHPDDAEIGAGGVLLKLAAKGYKTGIIDMTAGEMGTGGDEYIRAEEAKAAARILKLTVRECLHMPDCGLEDTYESRCKIAAVVRKYRPEVVLGPYYDLPPGRGLGHNDHIKGGYLVAHGANYAHLRKLPVEYEPWHPKAVYYYFLPPTLMPTFVVDITGYQDDYFAAIMAHESQFGRPGINEMIRNYFEGHITRWARWAGGKYAMAFYSDWPLRMDDPLAAAQARNPEGKQHE